MSDIDTEAMDGLKALDPTRSIREAGNASDYKDEYCAMVVDNWTHGGIIVL